MTEILFVLLVDHVRACVRVRAFMCACVSRKNAVHLSTDNRTTGSASLFHISFKRLNVNIMMLLRRNNEMQIS